MKKNLVIAGILVIMLVFGVTKAMADTVKYGFDDGTLQGWTIDASTYTGTNIKTLVPSVAQYQAGTYSLKAEIDVDEKWVGPPVPPTTYISDSIFVVPPTAENLQGYDKLRAYIYVPVNTVILDSAPLSMGVYIKTGSGWDYFVTNANQRVNISTAQEGTWVAVDINFSLCEDKTGAQGQQATNLNNVREIGVSFSGCGSENGNGTSAKDIDAYVDSITFVGAVASSDITVTVAGVTLGVSITGTINFGSVAMGSQTLSTSALTVTNTGTNPETYTLSLVNPATWTAVSTTPGTETYVLGAVFNSGAPALATFVAPEDSVLATPRQCTSAIFAGNDPGVSVPSAGTRSLWLLFRAPVSTSVTTQQIIRIIVSAALAT